MFRVVFFVLMILGIYIFFSPLISILGFIPLVGGFLKGTAGLVVILGAFLVSLPLFILTFGAAWLRYRPIIGGSCLALALMIIIGYSIQN